MKKAGVLALKKGDGVQHIRYGLCTVEEVMVQFDSIFGVVICPNTTEGKALLVADSAPAVCLYLEDSIRRLKPGKVEPTTYTVKCRCGKELESHNAIWYEKKPYCIDCRRDIEKCRKQ